MTRRCLALLALAAFLAAAAAVQAQKPTLDSRLDVRFEATPVADVLRHIVSGLGLELQLDPAVQGPVTLWVTHVSARTALNVVCDSVGCEWKVNGKRLVVSRLADASPKPVVWSPSPVAVMVADAATRKTVSIDLRERMRRPLPVDMQLQDVPVSTVLRAMSEASGLQITADEPLASTRVTLTSSEKTVADALQAIVKQAGGYNIAMFSVKDTSDAGAPAVKIVIKPRATAVKK